MVTDATFIAGASSVTAPVYTVYLTTETAIIPTANSLITDVYTFTYSITNKAQYSSLLKNDKNKTSSSTTSRSSSHISKTSTPSPTTPAAESGLPTGAKIGVGVGVGVGVLLLLALLAFFFYYRRTQRQKAEAAAARAYEKQELDSRGLPRTHGRDELAEQRAPVELDVNGHEQRIPRELAGTAIAELSRDPGKSIASSSEGTKVDNAVDEQELK